MAGQQIRRDTDLKWVDTVAGDLAGTHASMVGAAVVIARGGTAIGDGAGGVFTWVEPQQLPQDATTLINPPTPGGQIPGSWMRAFLDDSDIRRYGRLGASAADAATNTARINAAVAAQSQYQGAVIELPAGSWPIDGTILIEGKIGITLRGKGRHATTLYWVGPASNNSMIELRDSRACVIEEMAIQGPVKAGPLGLPDPASAPFAAIESSRHSPAGYEGTRHVFRNLEINYSGTTRYGIVFCGSLDKNNDYATLTSVSVHYAEVACLALMAEQSVGHMLVACNFGGAKHQDPKNPDAYPGAKYAVACGLSDPARMGVTAGGGFTWIGGGVESSVCNFFINWIGGSGAVSITGVNSEDSPRFFESGADGWGMNHMLKNPISIRDCRISTTNIAPDRKMVFHRAPGPLTFTGCTFHAGTGIPIIDLTIEQPTVHHITGNMWSMPGSDATRCIFPRMTPEHVDPDPGKSYPGGQLVIEDSNVFLNSNQEINSLGMVNQCRGVVTFTDVLTADQIQDKQTLTDHRVHFASPEPNTPHVNEQFPQTNPGSYYVATSVEVDETNPPADASRHATINSLLPESFWIHIGAPPGPPGSNKKVSVHWMIMR